MEAYPRLRVRIESSNGLDVNPAIMDVSSESSRESEFCIEELIDGTHGSDDFKSEGMTQNPRSSLVELSSVSSSSSTGDDNGDSKQIETQPEHDKQKDVIDHPSTSSSGGSGDTLDPTQAPPVQVIEGSNGYDPLRIPSSVFDSSTPLEWSVASNESLFSIHVGNNSFSRDQAVLFGDTFKSGELISLSPPPPPTMVEAEPVLEMPVKDSPKPPLISQNKDVSEIVSSRSSRRSNRSDDSGYSFAFPILVDRIKSNASERRNIVSDQLQQPTQQQPPTRASPPTEHTLPNSKKPTSKTGCFPCFRCCCPCSGFKNPCSCFSCCSWKH